MSYGMERNKKDRHWDRHYDCPTYTMTTHDGSKSSKLQYSTDGGFYNPEDLWAARYERRPCQVLYTSIDNKSKQGDEDFYNYYKGNYEYKKGKGWERK